MNMAYNKIMFFASFTCAILFINYPKVSGNDLTLGGTNQTTSGHNHTMGSTNLTASGHNHSMGGHNQNTGIPAGNHGNNHGSSVRNKHTPKNSAGHGTYFVISEHLTLFFKDWVSDSRKDYTVMCVVLGVLGILSEGLKLCRQHLSVMQFKVRRSNKFDTKAEVNNANTVCKEIGLHLLQLTIHVINIFIGYLLMLAFMTLNVYICVSVLAGYAIGYLTFGWKSIGISSDEDQDAC